MLKASGRLFLTLRRVLVISHAPVVLIIEDQDDVRAALQLILQRLGFEVVIAANGKEGLERMESGPAPTVILLDLWMPVMDGWEFLERGRPEIPVVVISGVGGGVHPLP